jgi:hypothetical protein
VIKDESTQLSDSLSIALMKMKFKAFMNCALDAGGRWAIDFPANDKFTFSLIQKGECWLFVHGLKYHLKAGDCVLLTGGKPYVFAKDLSVKRKIHAYQLFPNAKDGIAICNGGGEFFSIGAVFQFEGPLSKIMFGRLPPVIHIPADSDQASFMRWSLEKFSKEFRGQSIGRSLILNHLAPIMLIQTLRVYLSSAKREKNWLVALSDPKLARVIEVMHADYAKELRLQDFSNLAGMSRSGFALTFKKKVGIAPMDLTWPG